MLLVSMRRLHEVALEVGVRCNTSPEQEEGDVEEQTKPEIPEQSWDWNSYGSCQSGEAARLAKLFLGHPG